MIAAVLGSLSAGLLALLLYQKLFSPFFWQDLSFFLKFRSYKRAVRARLQQGVSSYLDCFLLQVKKNPRKAFIIFEEQTLSYRDVDRRSSQFARAFKSEVSLKPRDVVAVMMCNEPDFVCAWLGLCKLGCDVAFLNVHVKARSLLHCVRTCGARTLVAGADLLHVVKEVLADLKEDGVGVWLVDHASPCDDISSLLDKVENMSGESLSHIPKVNIMSNFMMIFTSGTTGLPKAAWVSHLKTIGSMAFFQLCGATSEDIVYITLPLYHMSASLLGVGGCINLGATCVLRRKFSASHFWKDCVTHNVTVVQYIGELCRYLLNHPVVPEERAHRVRLAAGSGLRADIWRKFITRFGIGKVREGYGLTESSIGFLNYTDEVGPIGRASYFNKLCSPFELLKYDPESCEPVRTDAGRCIPAQPGELGILVTPLTAVNQFLGYAGNKVQSEKKLLRDVFQARDVFFNTGDLLLRDHRDFLYFRDRIGDTFRWKGENVSTTEVSEILGLLDFIRGVNVYGVAVPGYEGRAGMAAVVLKEDLPVDGRRLFSLLVETLPAYAWPWFLRVRASLDVTETFKQQKLKLVQEGFNPQTAADPLYVLDVSQRDFVPLTAAVYQDVLSGRIRL